MSRPVNIFDKFGLLIVTVVIHPEVDGLNKQLLKPAMRKLFVDLEMQKKA